MTDVKCSRDYHYEEESRWMTLLERWGMAMMMMMMMETEEVMVVMGEDMDGMEDMTGVAELLQEEVED